MSWSLSLLLSQERFMLWCVSCRMQNLQMRFFSNQYKTVFTGEAAESDPKTFLEEKTHQILRRAGGGHCQEPVQGAHLILEPSGLEFVHPKWLLSPIFTYIKFWSSKSSLPYFDIWVADVKIFPTRKVAATLDLLQNPASWAQTLRTLCWRARTSGSLSSQIGSNLATRCTDQF